MNTIMGIRFNMKATVLVDYHPTASNDGPDVDDAVIGGHWQTVQDELTGALKRIWIEDIAVVTPGAVGTPKEGVNRFDIECYVRGFPEVGFRSSANTESYEEGLYKALENIQMTYPAEYELNRRQFVTNIRSIRDDKILWLEEETGQPTVFEVQGVTPTFDPFGRHIDNLAVLRRSVVQ